MDILKNVEKVINNLSLTTNASFSALYYGEEVVYFKSLDKDKGKLLADLASLLVRKFIRSDDLIGTPEYLFTEGKGYAIFLFNAGGNLTIVSLIDGKPNFSLLRLEHDKASQSLDSIKGEIPALLEKLKEEQRQLEEKEKEISEETKPENVAQEPSESVLTESVEEIEDSVPVSETEDAQSEKTSEEEHQEEIQLDEDIKELEEIFSEDTSTVDVLEEKEEKENIETQQQIETSSQEQEEDVPSLEEILLGEESLGEEVDTEVIEKIKLKFIEEIGPVGKILFSRVSKKVGIDLEKPYRNKVEELINSLAEEIMVESRKEDFLKYCKDLLE